MDETRANQIKDRGHKTGDKEQSMWQKLNEKTAGDNWLKHDCNGENILIPASLKLLVL